MQNPSDEELRDIYSEARTIAVVGASGDESKPAHTIPRYLQRQ
ncbi:MAG TPA: CoA-binding protein, partial [Actinomycetota bacterium]|nr:CoA-binding protein [Actinomycetota bacterium]